MMTGQHHALLEQSCAKFVAAERAWSKGSPRGRWVVLERGPGRLLRDSPRHLRDYVDAITPQRGRRFTSLSRARAFARNVDGIVRRWRNPMPDGKVWQKIGAWEHALRGVRHSWKFRSTRVQGSNL